MRHFTIPNLAEGKGKNLPERAPNSRMGARTFLGGGLGGGFRTFTPANMGAGSFFTGIIWVGG